MIFKIFSVILKSSRTPRGIAIPRLEVNAGCRACCEGLKNNFDKYVIVEVYTYGGVICRTVSGWKHSSTKIDLAGVLIVGGESIRG